MKLKETLFILITTLLLFLVFLLFPRNNPNKVVIPDPTINTIPKTIPESELNKAINTYREEHGETSLKVNEGLCTYARKRVKDMFILNGGEEGPRVDHQEFNKDVESKAILKYADFSVFGENIAYAKCINSQTNETKIVETGEELVGWCFDSSEEHKENLLDVWTDMCSSGQFPYYVQIFAE